MPEIYPKLTLSKLKAWSTKDIARERTRAAARREDRREARSGHRQVRLSGQSRPRRDDRQGDAHEKECRQERSAFRAGLAALSEQGASPLEQQGCALVRMWMRV